jgi:hypothetical protein
VNQIIQKENNKPFFVIVSGVNVSTLRLIHYKLFFTY